MRTESYETLAFLKGHIAVSKNHVFPNYGGHKIGTFGEVGACMKCDRVALYQEFHPVSPCPACGSMERKWFAAKWVPAKAWWNILRLRGRWVMP